MYVCQICQSPVLFLSSMAHVLTCVLGSSIMEDLHFLFLFSDQKTRAFLFSFWSFVHLRMWVHPTIKLTDNKLTLHRPNAYIYWFLCYMYLYYCSKTKAEKKETPAKCTHTTIADGIPSLPKFQFLLTGVETNFTLWPGGPGKIDFKLDNYITDDDVIPPPHTCPRAHNSVDSVPSQK